MYHTTEQRICKRWLILISAQLTTCVVDFSILLQKAAATVSSSSVKGLDDDRLWKANAVI